MKKKLSYNQSVLGNSSKEAVEACMYVYPGADVIMGVSMTD
jgi:hypothetical protein